jgi:hypothetical protein
MSYVNCPRCRLTVRLRDDALTPEFCPRCAARHGVHSKVYLSATPARLFTRGGEIAAAEVATAATPGPAAPA